MVNKLTIPSPSLYCCYATIVHALSDLLVETLVVYKRCSAALHRVVNRICFWRIGGSRESLFGFLVYNDTFRCARQRLLRRELCDNLLDLSNNEVATSDKDGVGGQSQRLSACYSLANRCGTLEVEA